MLRWQAKLQKVGATWPGSLKPERGCLWRQACLLPCKSGGANPVVTIGCPNASLRQAPKAGRMPQAWKCDMNTLDLLRGR